MHTVYVVHSMFNYSYRYVFFAQHTCATSGCVFIRRRWLFYRQHQRWRTSQRCTAAAAAEVTSIASWRSVCSLQLVASSTQLLRERVHYRILQRLKSPERNLRGRPSTGLHALYNPVQYSTVAAFDMTGWCNMCEVTGWYRDQHCSTPRLSDVRSMPNVTLIYVFDRRDVTSAKTTG